jgi:POT family proton-dependent oligopeptide transporter
MGVWFMSTATANKFAGELSALYPEEVKIEKQVSISPAQLQLLSSSLIPNEVLTGEPKGVYALPVVNLESTDKSISTLAPAGDSRLEVSRYHLKLIKGANGKFVSGAVTADGQFLVANRDNEVVDIWNLKPEKPTFLGMKVENLYDFFMIFFWMAGVAAVLLFSIHRWLKKMMHGKG